VLLAASSQTLFKLWRIVPGLRHATVLLTYLTVAALIYVGWNHTGSLPAIQVRSAAVTAMVVVAGASLLAFSRRVIRTQASLGRLAITVLALVAWIPARLQLHLLDPLFLRLGKLDRLPRD
jgi:hypothetical protein